MSNPIPNQLALTNIADGSAQQAAPIRNNFATIQTAENEVIAALSGGAAGQVLQAADSTHVQWVYQGGLYRKTTAKQVVNTVAETDLLNGEIAVAAGALGTSGVLRLTAWGDWFNNSGGVQSLPLLKVKLGATTVFQAPSMTGFWSASASRLGWRLQAEIANAGAANAQTAAMLLKGAFANGVGNGLSNFAVGQGSVAVLAVGSGFGTVDGIADGAGYAIDTTVAQVLAFTCTHPVANAAIDMTLRGALVEVL